MELLLLSVRPPGSSDPRTFHLLKALAARNHAVTLVCGATPHDAAALNELRPYCADVYTAPIGERSAFSAALRLTPTALPFSTAPALDRNLLAAVQDAARAHPHAVAHLAGLSAAPLGVGLRGLPAVIDLGDCASLQHLRTLLAGLIHRDGVRALLALGRSRRYETQLGTQFERVLVASPDAAWMLRTLAAEQGAAPQAPISVLTDGIDLTHYAPQAMLRAANELVLSHLPAAHADAAVRFLGNDVLPRIWQTRADVQLSLVGVPMTPAVRTLARDSRVALLPAQADPRPTLAHATLACIPPLPTGGVPPGLLEALAMGTPVVAAAQIARGTAFSDGHDLLLAATADEFARAVLALLDDPGYRGRLGRAGRQYVERYHQWDEAAAQAEQIYAAAMGAEIADWRLDMGLHRRLRLPDLPAAC